MRYANFLGEERKPKAFTCEDMAKAKEEWEAEHPGESWDDLRTQSKNGFARDQAYHREFAELSEAIKKWRR